MCRVDEAKELTGVGWFRERREVSRLREALKVARRETVVRSMFLVVYAPVNGFAKVDGNTFQHSNVGGRVENLITRQ